MSIHYYFNATNFNVKLLRIHIDVQGFLELYWLLMTNKIYLYLTHEIHQVMLAGETKQLLVGKRFGQNVT